MWQRHIPNLITLFRFLLIPPVLWLILHQRSDLALVLFALAGLSDGLDGWLARRHGWRSRLGAFLDPLADKTLMTTTTLLLGWQHMLPWWLVAIIIGRDLIILAGAAAFHLLTQRLEMQPSLLSKFNTVVQIVLVVAVLWHHGVASLPQMLMNGLMGLALFTTLASGLDYVVRWSDKARAALRS
ncbi:MAG: CDP-alcohol phosphatidyltransferase family protein [Gammaproteobacteria bacterium]|nr:MAG: CDP-alcohol phosphatidyltransferase family protein [Gammaproteobacteria bacterium]